MQNHATAPSSPMRHLCSGRGGGDCDEDGGGGGGHYFFFSAPASPVHYILRSPPSSTAAASSASTHDSPDADSDFEFAARHHGAGAGMSSAEELFLAGRIRVGCLSPIRQETAYGEQEEDEDDEEGKGGVDGDATRLRRARSASRPRSPRIAKSAEPPDSFASASSSSSAKKTGRRISLRDLLGRTGSHSAVETAAGAERSGFWPPSIWPSRPKKALPCPAAQQGRRYTSSDRAAPRRRTTSLPYLQGLVLGCVGFGPFGARSYGLAKSMHPLPSR